ncbi:MAG: choice-of-anchor tandem repeat GloVer-containing protein [Candidatus Sulfotelmatobacter sp.]
MKININELCVPALISVSLLFGFAAQAGAQSPNFDRLSHSPQWSGDTKNTPREDSPLTTSTYTEDVLYSFCPVSGCTDGKVPTAGLIRDTAGNLYGTTSGGGAHGGGTVFKIDTTGKYTVVYSFCSVGGSSCTDGSNPFGGLIEDSAGNLYGTTLNGGAYSVVGGTVFKIDSAGQETVLYSFCASSCLDGQAPEAGLVRDAAGNLYGTTGGGGTHSDGTVFKVDTTGKETVLYNFCSTGGTSCTDGNFPFAGLIEDAAGNLYGTTERGGANNKGTVFKVDAAGTETVLYSFCSVGGTSCTDGYSPEAGVIEDAEGNLYGTTLLGGANTSINFGFDSGTVFKLDTTGKETVLYSFCSVGGANCTDGFGPAAGLIQDAAGNLYGTTGSGGAGGDGTVFELNTTGQETVLYSFCTAANCADGWSPDAGVIQDASGNLYGTTANGGATYNGIVFKLAVAGLTPMVTLTSALNPSFVDQSVTFTAVVSGSGATPTGSVTFEEGTTALGTATLAKGKATLKHKFTTSGTFSIVANYSGDSNYNAASSTPVSQVVNVYTTTTALTSSLNPSTYGEVVDLTATVTSSGPTATGKVTFNNGSISLGSKTLSGGAATLKISTLNAGTSTITATYAGDAAHSGSTSKSLNQVVDQATTTTAVTSSLNPSTVGEKVKFTATVTSSTTKPTGSVKFMDGTTLLATETLSAGKASYTTTGLSEGTHNITAVYEGTSNITGSTSPVLAQVVN